MKQTEVYVAIHKEIEERVLELVQGSHESYCEMQYAGGLGYLSVMVADEDKRKKLEGSRLFWGWWRNQWVIRDAEYVKGCDLAMKELGNVKVGIDIKLAVYLDLHDVRVLMGELAIPKGIMNGF